MKKTTISTILVLISLISWVSNQALAYTLHEAVARGLEANFGLNAQELVVQEAEKGKLTAYGNFLPTVSLVGQKTKLTNDNNSVLVNTDYLNQDRDFRSIRLSQPIFSGHYGVASIKKADNILKFQEAELENSKGRLVLEINRQFIQYLKLQDDSVRLHASVERLKKQLAAAQAFYDQQMAPKLHVMQAEVALARARQRLTQVEMRQGTTRMTLNQILALGLEQSVSYSGSLAEMDYDTHKSLADYVRDAKVRPDVKQARLNVDISEQDSLLIVSRNLPKISVDFSYNKSDTNYADNSRYRDENTEYWSTVFNISMQLFHGGQTISSALQQNITTKRYKKNIQELLSKVETDVTNQYEFMVEAKQRIASSIDIKEASTRSYERAERRYTSGLGTSVDVLNAQNDVSLAEADIVQARADYQTSKAELEYLSGSFGY